MDDQKAKAPAISDPPPNQTLALEKPKKPPRNKYALACATLASMISILSGYDGAVMSGASVFIQKYLKINDTQVEILAGIINPFALVGSIAAGRTSDWIGRHYTIIFAAAIFLAGALLMGLAPNYAILMVGRLVAGVGIGYALMIAPVYTAEIAPTSSRGFLTSFPEVFINVGILLGYVSNLAFAKLPDHLNWRIMFCVGAVPPIFVAIAVLAMPESPRWLVMQGRLGEAERVLAKTSDTPEEAQLRLLEIKEAAGIPENCNDEVVAESKKNHGEGVWKDLLLRPTPSVRRILIAAIGLQFFQQASGIDSVVLYSPRVFEKAGLKSDSNSLGATVAVGFMKTAAILVATFLLDRVGRRPLLLSSAGGMVISLVILASSLSVIEHHPHEKLTWAAAMSISTVLTFVGSFSIGLGPIAWVYTSEIFPLRLRAQGASLGTATNRIVSGVISMTFISLYKTITIAGSYFFYAGIAAAGWLFFYFFLPETRGRSLEDMEVLFGKKPEGGEEEKVEAEVVHRGGEDSNAKTEV
ncbi:polyol transporter 5-like isoform X1 [Phoenix dactylifera]|uniref:Polyol transporter 5-like isoform X1 n=1 Tax=Phoenix dactylifera TaxID=42345 RepID=A0A8B8ZYJ3_PHODC|nr:polyol transporter 5-like isoform X1 [Phoenix dactylifera]